MSFEIKDAEWREAPISVYLDGKSGSGKTYSALLLARGLAGPKGKIGVIDTEGKRALVYSDDPDIGGFRHLEFTPPYSPEACIDAFKAAQADGWDVIIFDSASLEHDGEGGLLDIVEKEAEALEKRNPQNRAISQQKWTKPKLRHKRFLNYAVGIPSHVICCFRMTLTTDFDAKPPTTIQTPVAEKNTKFALELHATIGDDHRAHWTRVPKPYAPMIEQDALITIAMGAALANRAKGTPEEKKPAPAPRAKAKAAPPKKETKADSERAGLIMAIEAGLSAEHISDAELTEAMVRLAEDVPDWRDLQIKFLKGLEKAAGWKKAVATVAAIRKEEAA